MKDDKAQPSPRAGAASAPSRILGSLRDALAAASRDDRSGAYRIGAKAEAAPAAPASAAESRPAPSGATSALPPTRAYSAADAVRDAKAVTRDHFETEPTTGVVGTPKPAQAAAIRSVAAANDANAPKTQALRGKPKNARSNFHQDPVVAWLVIVGGPGLGAFRPIYEGNNAIGRGKTQRVSLDYGDETISSEEQAFIRYDSVDRSFLFVPNLAKTNIVAVNEKKPTGAVKLEMMDVIRMGQTQLAFVPFCGEAFDWSELSELKE